MNEEIDLIEKEQKWSWIKFVIGFAKMVTSPEFIVFGIITTMLLFFVFYGKVPEYAFIVVWATYGVVGVAFMFHKAIHKLISEKTTVDVKANANFGATATLTGDLSKATGEVVNNIKR
jgi:hypothetical protein